MVELKVRRILRSRGSPSSTVDDALQTAAERAFVRAETFDSVQGWINWTVKVSWHEVQAQWKRDARSAPCESLEFSGGRDPATVVEQELELAAAIRGLRELGPDDRQAIVEGLDDGASGVPLAAREKMRRYRARRRLASVVAGWRVDPLDRL